MSRSFDIIQYEVVYYIIRAYIHCSKSSRLREFYKAFTRTKTVQITALLQ